MNGTIVIQYGVSVPIGPKWLILNPMHDHFTNIYQLDFINEEFLKDIH